MVVNRRLSSHIQTLAKYYPVVSLTGPRQAGKTTLLSQLFPAYRYLSLEEPTLREEAQLDPRAFLAKYDRQVIFDEAQRVPELFNYLQGVVDADREPGRYVISGSQNFLLHRNITQSLAGRVGIARLFPFDFQELRQADLLPKDPGAAMIRGGYPNALVTDIPARYFFADYVSSYLERDVGEFVNTSNMANFQRFLQICTFFAGQLINVSQIATMAQVNVKTVNAWLSILEASYIVFRLPPYFNNLGKRLTKSPKLYFYDTGLLCYLLNARNVEELRVTNKYGAVFENLVIAERTKSLYHAGERPLLSFFRDNNGLEADLVEGGPHRMDLTEIMSGTTWSAKWDKTIRRIGNLAEVPVTYRVVYGGDEEPNVVAGTEYRPWFLAGWE